MDRGAELLRQHGELEMERHLQQFAKSLGAMVRQGDLAVKYTAWAIAFILPDTAVTGAQAIAEKLRRAGAEIQPGWAGPAPTLSTSVAEAILRPSYEGEDIVTELINRAAAGLEETRIAAATRWSLCSPRHFRDAIRPSFRGIQNRAEPLNARKQQDNEASHSPRQSAIMTQIG